MTAEDQGGDLVRIDKFAAKTPEGQRRQNGNLKPQAPMKHGAYSPETLKPVREAILRELQASFPGVRVDRLEVAAARRARIVLMQDFLDDVGIIAHRKHATFRPFLIALQRDETAYLAELTKIEDLQRAAGTNGKPNAQAIIDSYTGGGDGS